MANRDLTIRIDGDSGGFERSMKSAAASASVFERELKKAEAAEAKRHQAMGQMGKATVAAGAAMAAGLALAANAAMKWESAWAGVTKTVNGSSAQMNALEGDLRDMAKTLPATHGEIAGIAEAAGQLGVKREDIVGFTKTMIDLGVSTNLTADQAATAIAQFSNVMGTMERDGSKGIERLGATLVALGNAGASTEADIMNMAARLVGAGKLIGASESDVLALANAMSSMGVEAENGGGVMTRTLLKIYTATKQGGGALDGFAKIAGMSGAAFTKAFGVDPVRTADTFIKGLGRIDSAGGDVVGALRDVGITGSRDLQVLLSLKGAGDLLTDSLDLGNKAWNDNTALVNEANKRYETTASKMKVAKNQVNDLAISLGDVMLPAIGKVAGGVSELAGFLEGLPGPAKTALVILGTLGATIGLVGGAALLTVPKIAAMKVALETMGVSANVTGKAMTGLGIAMKGAAIAGAAAALLIVVDQLVNAMADSAPGVNALTVALADFGKTGQATGALAEIVGKNFGDLNEVLDRAGQRKYLSFDFGTTPKDIEEARRKVAALDAALASLVAGGHADVAAKFLAQSGLNAKDAADNLPAYTEAVAGAQAQTKLAKPAVDDFNHALGETKEQAQEAQQAIDDLSKAAGDFIAPMKAYTDVLASLQKEDQARAEKSAKTQNDSVDKKITAVQREYDARIDAARKTKGVSDAAIQKIEDERDATVKALGEQKKSWQDYASDVHVSVAAYLTELDKQVEAQKNWQRNLTLLAGRVSGDTLAELAKLGPEGAPLVAALATASDAQLARLETDFAARSKAATDAFAAQLMKANPVLAYLSGTIGEKAAQALAAKLAEGKTTVDAIMKKYNLTITDGVVVPLTKAQIAAEKLLASLKALGLTRAGDAADDKNRQTHVKRASGGYISGPGSGTSDSIPAYLSNGEYVVNAAATHRNRAQLDAMNSGRSHFATGGVVSTTRISTSSSTFASDARRTFIAGDLIMQGVRSREDARDRLHQLRDEAWRQGWVA